MKIHTRRRLPVTLNLAVVVGIAILGCGLTAGCRNSSLKDFKFPKLTSQPASKSTESEKKAQAEEAVLRRKTSPLPGTVGSVCMLGGMQSVFVQGYGLVAGLAGTGSGDCPEQVRKELISTITRYQKLYGDEKAPFSASELLNSRETAVVKVFGTIPAGSVKGDPFDLVIQALPNTGTTSLEGGRLYACDLRVYSGPLGQTAGSRVYARGEGSIFINPFEKKKYRGSTLLRREGYILGGGMVLEDRKLTLTLRQPAYGMARSIEQRINSLFGPPPENPLWQTARAVNADRVDLQIPRQHRRQLGHFLGLVLNLYIRSDPSYLETGANELASRVSDPAANGPAIAYAWEAMGRGILPLIQPLYTASNKQAAFYSAKAGARLGDIVAMEQLARMAHDPASTYRQRAVRTLGFCRDQTARRTLRNLLDDANVSIRLSAYRGLVRLADATVSRRFVGEGNFILDVVQCRTLPMVYATRSRISTVVLFGNLAVEPPVFYCHADDLVTLSAGASDRQVSLLRKTPSGKSSGKVTCSLDLPSLILLMGSEAAVDKTTGQVRGLGLSYSQVVAVLHQLCQDGSIPAKFKMQDLRAAAEPPDDIIGRPEKD